MKVILTPCTLGITSISNRESKTASIIMHNRCIGETVLLPVVQDDFATHSMVPILGFAAFYIEDAKPGSHPYIQGHFVKDYPVPEGTPEGPYFGASVNEAKLVF